MKMDSLARRLYPRQPSGRRIYKLKVLMVSVTFGLMVGGILVALMFLRAGTVK